MKQEKYPKDRGCFLHPSCLTCPEEVCVFDFPGGIKAFLKDQETKRLMEEGIDPKTMAEQLCIHKRTAERRIQRTQERVTA